MLTQELHIEVDLLVQKLDSNWNKDFQPQEVDWILNNEILKFFKQRLVRPSNSKGLAVFDTIKRTVDLSPLLKTKKLDVQYNNKGEAVVKLPLNYLMYVSSNSSICCSCNLEEAVGKKYYTSTFPPLKKGLTSFTSTGTLTSYTIDILIGNTAINLFRLSEVPVGYLPSDNGTVKNRFLLRNAILAQLKQKTPAGVDADYDDSSNSFIINTPYPHSIKFVVNGGASTFVAKEVNYKYNFKSKKDLRSDIRIIDEEFSNEIKRSYLSGAKDESNIGELREKEILLTSKKGVIFQDLYLTYFCKPTKIDLYLDIHSELPDVVLKEVVNNAGATILGIISSDTYEKYKAENILIE
jgi:hypothetical protein